MSPPPPLKRRRLDNSDALSKPFKSPFKTPLKATANAPQPSPLQTPSALSTPSVPKPKARAPPISSPPKPHSPSKPSPELLALRRQQASLQSTLSTARSELDTYTQALKIEESKKDAELEGLIKKWRGVSKEAAEEVFGVVRDRVNRMGGVKAWREGERKKKEGFGGSYGWADAEDQAKEGNSGDEDRGGEDVGEAEAREVQAGVEEEERRREKEEQMDEEEGFTMDMMLKSLNIELDVIGFDKDGQKWIE